MDRLRFYITPVINYESPPSYAPIYGDELEITNDVISIKELKRQIERDDGEIGNFDYDNIGIKVNNMQGKFNQPIPYANGKTIFIYKRQNARIRITYLTAEGLEIDIFVGLLNENLTKTTSVNETLDLKFVSLVAILSNLDMKGGLAIQGQKFSNVIKNILTQPAVAKLLNYNPANINLGIDIEIDDVNFFQKQKCKGAMDALLKASNSILIVHNFTDIIIRKRGDFTNANNYLRDEDILRTIKFSDGSNKLFNKIIIGDTIAKKDSSIGLEGLRDKTFNDLDEFIIDESKRLQVCNAILSTLSQKKPEIEISIILEKSIGLDMLDVVDIEILGYLIPKDKHLPIIDNEKFGEFSTPFQIEGFALPKTKFYIIDIIYDLKNLTTKLKLKKV